MEREYQIRKQLRSTQVAVHPIWKSIHDTKAGKFTEEQPKEWSEAWEDLRNFYTMTGEWDNSERMIYQLKATYIVYVEPENVWRNRFETKQTPRQAIRNLGKDDVREGWKWFVQAEDKRTFIAHRLDSAVRLVKHQAKNWETVWQIRQTELGEERTLTPFGKWLLETFNYYANCPDHSFERLLKEIQDIVGEE